MKVIKFKTKCPYEIGDKIKFEKTGKIDFVLELDGWYKLDTKLHEIKTT